MQSRLGTSTKLAPFLPPPAVPTLRVGGRNTGAGAGSIYGMGSQKKYNSRKAPSQGKRDKGD